MPELFDRGHLFVTQLLLRAIGMMPPPRSASIPGAEPDKAQANALPEPVVNRLPGDAGPINNRLRTHCPALCGAMVRGLRRRLHVTQDVPHVRAPGPQRAAERPQDFQGLGL